MLEENDARKHGRKDCLKRVTPRLIDAREVGLLGSASERYKNEITNVGWDAHQNLAETILAEST